MDLCLSGLLLKAGLRLEIAAVVEASVQTDLCLFVAVSFVVLWEVVEAAV